MIHSVVGNDVNIQLRREINQSIGQRCLVKPGAGRKSTAAQHDFCDPGQMGKFGNLIGYIVAIYGFRRMRPAAVPDGYWPEGALYPAETSIGSLSFPQTVRLTHI